VSGWTSRSPGRVTHRGGDIEVGLACLHRAVSVRSVRIQRAILEYGPPLVIATVDVVADHRGKSKLGLRKVRPLCCRRRRAPYPSEMLVRTDSMHCW